MLFKQIKHFLYKANSYWNNQPNKSFNLKCVSTLKEGRRSTQLPKSKTIIYLCRLNTVSPKRNFHYPNIAPVAPANIASANIAPANIAHVLNTGFVLVKYLQ